MDEHISVSLRTISGQPRLLSPKRSMTVRDLLAIADISWPANACPLCLYRGSHLELDLSLAHQHIEDLSTIVVTFRRGSPLRPSARHGPGFIHEALRVSDLSFLELESARHAPMLYQAMLDEQLDSDSDDENDPERMVILTVIDESARSRGVAESPLPPCWAQHHHGFR
jgi:hypothetical protein